MENQQKPVQSDEIDLGVLFAKLGDFLKGIWSGLMRFLYLVKNVPQKNKTVFIVTTVLLIALVVVYGTFLKKKFYESTMVLSSNYLNSRIMEGNIEKLNSLAAQNDKSVLAKLLNIPVDSAIQLAQFEVKPFIDQNELVELELLKEKLRNAGDKKQDEQVISQVISRIEIENRHSFEIKVRSYNSGVFSGLQKSIVSYFRDNDYIKKRIEITRTNLEQRKKKLISESQKLDSLKRVIYSNYKTMAEQGRQGSNNVILSDRAVTNPIEVYNQDLSLYSEIQNIDRQLYIQPDFEVVDGFTEFSEPASASLPKMIIEAIAIAIALSYLIVALREFNKYLSKFDSAS